MVPLPIAPGRIVILIGIDDTDTLSSPGTNQLARRLVARLPRGYRATMILRHQLLFDPRIPYTSQNGSASIGMEADPDGNPATLLTLLRQEIRAWYVSGSDPGLCVADRVPPGVVEFGRRCQRDLVTQREARDLARDAGLLLEGFGGTEDGVIGALAAVGLRAGGDDGRVIHRPAWTWPDGFAGAHPVAAIRARGVDEVREVGSDAAVEQGTVDVGKRLRPNVRQGRVVLFVERAGPVLGGSGGAEWRALKLP